MPGLKMRRVDAVSEIEVGSHLVMVQASSTKELPIGPSLAGGQVRDIASPRGPITIVLTSATNQSSDGSNYVLRTTDDGRWASRWEFASEEDHRRWWLFELEMETA